MMRWRWLPATLAAALCLVAAPALADEGRDNEPAPAPSKVDEDLEALLKYLETWDGNFDRLVGFIKRRAETPDQLQAMYDRVPAELRQQVDGKVEYWSFEGGIGLGGGVLAETASGGDAGGLFRLSLSAGVAWPVGGYDIPVYYVFTDIPGPWAVGFQTFFQADNFSSVAGGATLRVAYDYLGTTPYLELGPAVRFDGDLAPGARLEVGYGNILLQGFVQADQYFADQQPLTVVAGIRVPWLLFTLF